MINDDCKTSTAKNVLAIEAADVPPFLRASLKDRSLSAMVADLNRAIMAGDAAEQREARKALEHLGFI